ncbi:MAG: hypothetical protein JXA20_09805 [Spirochaetes bacterium]|nr:hypothetical protein [Spirochaetota bacterium]
MKEDGCDATTRIRILGGLGILGALLILASDLMYNLGGGDRFGVNLYFTTYLGVFSFPLWWGGIWVIYRGLRQAGPVWSFLPCVLFAYLVSTVNVSGHASYPYWAAFKSLKLADNAEVVRAAEIAEMTALQYSGVLLRVIQPLLEIIVCVWMTIPIAMGKTVFPRWILVFIPIFPTLSLMALNTVIPGIFDSTGPYVGSGCMIILFSIATVIVARNERSKVPTITS